MTILFIIFVLMTISKIFTGKFHPGILVFLGIISTILIISSFVLDFVVSFVWVDNPIFKKTTHKIHLYSRFLFNKIKNLEA
jgi:hypothetical protein